MGQEGVIRLFKGEDGSGRDRAETLFICPSVCLFWLTLD